MASGASFWQGACFPAGLTGAESQGMGKKSPVPPILFAELPPIHSHFLTFNSSCLDQQRKGCLQPLTVLIASPALFYVRYLPAEMPPAIGTNW